MLDTKLKVLSKENPPLDKKNEGGSEKKNSLQTKQG